MNQTNVIYRMYGQSKKNGWELISTNRDVRKVREAGECLDKEQFYGYLIIEHDITNDCDFTVEEKLFTKECKVKYVDDLEQETRVVATTFKPAEIMRETKEDYVR